MGLHYALAPAATEVWCKSGWQTPRLPERGEGGPLTCHFDQQQGCSVSPLLTQYSARQCHHLLVRYLSSDHIQFVRRMRYPFQPGCKGRAAFRLGLQAAGVPAERRISGKRIVP